MTSYSNLGIHCSDVIMRAIASQITGVSIVCTSVGSGGDQRKHQSSASLAFVREIQPRSVNTPHKRPVSRKMSPFDDVIMWNISCEIAKPYWCLVNIFSGNGLVLSGNKPSPEPRSASHNDSSLFHNDCNTYPSRSYTTQKYLRITLWHKLRHRHLPNIIPS